MDWRNTTFEYTIDYNLTMKELFLIRHAEAFAADSGSKDFERSLTNKGMRDAAMTGAFMASQKMLPQVTYFSAAHRAAETARLICSHLGPTVHSVETEELYEASPRTLLQFINQLSEEYNSVTLIGHNPAITYLAEYLTKAEVGNMYPASLVQIKIENLKWSEISQGSGSLLQMRNPEE